MTLERLAMQRFVRILIAAPILVMAYAIWLPTLGLSPATASAQQPSMTMHEEHMRQMSGDGQSPAGSLGQAAFQAMTDIVQELDADPGTDWEQVDLAALREHLVDMNRLVLESQVEARATTAGAIYRITGDHRTMAAARRMLPAHAVMLQHTEPSWRVTVTEVKPGLSSQARSSGRETPNAATLEDGSSEGLDIEVTLIALTSEQRDRNLDDPALAAQLARIRGLGFFGMLTLGSHHAIHHRAMASGNNPH